MNKLKEFQELLKSENNFLLFDIEANTDGDMNIQDMRIIQIGYLIFNNNFEVLEKGSIFVNQKIELTDFIKELTGITQEQVDNGLLFKEAMSKFKEKVSTCNYYMSFGNYDLKQFYYDCQYNGENYIFDELSEYRNSKHFNIKDIISKKLDIKSKGMEKLAEYLGVNMEGRIHNGEDDCFNILKIIKHVFGNKI